MFVRTNITLTWEGKDLKVLATRSIKFNSGDQVMEIKPTQEQYESLQQIYDFMNQQLFGGQLPAALITFQKKRGS